MFVALDRGLRRQRRRLVVLAAVLALGGAVFTAHGAIAGDHMGDGIAVCVAIAQTAAAAAVGVVAARCAWLRRPLLQLALFALPAPWRPPATAAPTARAGPSGPHFLRL